MQPYDGEDFGQDGYGEPMEEPAGFTTKHKIIAGAAAAVIAAGGALFAINSGDSDEVAEGEFTPMDILVASQEDRDSAEAANKDNKANQDTANLAEPDLPDGTPDRPGSLNEVDEPDVANNTGDAGSSDRGDAPAASRSGGGGNDSGGSGGGGDAPAADAAVQDQAPARAQQVSNPNPDFVEEGTSQRDLVEPQEVSAPAEQGTPVKITVPDKYAGVDKTAVIDPVGHIGPSDAATLAPPQDISRIGWYGASAEPGEDGEGTIVMTGHINYDGVVGFASLFTHLAPGDIIKVETENGDVHEYKVSQEVYQVPKTLDEEYVQMTEDTLQRSTGPESLVLLTCGGAFDPNSPLGYQDNMIVVADPT